MLQIGDEFRHKYSYTQDDVDTYARVSGDTNPLHIDAAAGKASMFGRNIIHGFLGASVFTKIFGALWYADGHVYMSQNIKWLKPVRPGDVLSLRTEVLEVRPMKSKPNTGLVHMMWQCLNQKDEIVTSMQGWMMFLKRERTIE